LSVFENRALRRLFVPKRDEVTGWGRKMNNKELHNLYSSSNIIRAIKSGKMRWRSRNTIGEIRKLIHFSQGRSLCVDGRIIEK
jgi:hypothetical protein